MLKEGRPPPALGVEARVGLAQPHLVGQDQGVEVPQGAGELDPELVRVQFVGVAPTPEKGGSRGGHFYASAKDKLRVGLFRLLETARRSSCR